MKKLGTSKIVVIHPMKSERHSEKAHRCIDCGNRIKDAFGGCQTCSCGTQNICTTRTDRKNKVVYITTHYTL